MSVAKVKFDGVWVPFSVGRMGPPGPTGPQGPPGTDGDGIVVDYEETFAFAVPNASWVIAHMQDTFALNVEAFDTIGDLIECEVDYLDSNTIVLTWFYPMTGYARVFN